ncbi:MAG TPA: glycosyltransferase [Casimicrobiaceae bacterium]
MVIAVQQAQANLPDILAALRPGAHPDVEFIFCHAAAAPEQGRNAGDRGNLVERYGGPGALVPQLWAEGVRAARGTWVATTTAHCIPASDWVARLKAHLDEPVAAVGGVLANDAAAGPIAWAIYLLRYTAFAAPQAGGTVTELAADNALYRRAHIVEQQDLLADGFWEPAFHARWRAAGHELRLDPALVVTHRNRYRAGEFFRQRLAHGRQFGFARAAAWPRGRRLAMLLGSPLLPLVFLRKIVRAARRHPVCSRHVWPAAGWLLVFAGAWGIGEATGYWAALKNGGSP